MNTASLIILAVVVLLAVFVVLALIFKKGEKRVPDYYVFFIMGIVWIILGIPLKNEVLSIIGIAFTVIGAVNYKKWKTNRKRWNELNKKQRKTTIVIIIIMALIIIIGIGALIYVRYSEQKQIIGGEKDEFGCLIPAGYSWNSTIGACVREWELDENQRKAAELAVNYVKSEDGLIILNVQPTGCEGCYIVELEKGEDKIKLTLENYNVIKKSLTPDECIDVGGRIVNLAAKESCNTKEKNIGEIFGFVSTTSVCCFKIESFKDCLNAGYPVAETDPRQCFDGTTVWTEDSTPPVANCVNMCGDGLCQVVACLSTTCPCSESVVSCPEDCKK